ncbi:MAG: hypothetical protein P8O09_03345 [Flavobacteriaceae bacterium]|nr:hypothetical protein [Flavobacteriaceae bacterium]
MIFDSFFKLITSFSDDINQRKSFSYLILRGVSIVSNYVFSLLVINLFSKESYGFFVYGLSIFMILSTFLKAGVDVHYVKIFHRFKDLGVPFWIKKLERRVVLCSVATAVLVSTLVYSYNLAGEASVAIIPFIISVPLCVFVHLNSAKLRSISKISQFAFLNIAGRVVFSLVFFLFFYYVLLLKSPILVSVAHFFSIILLLFFSYIWVNKTFFLNKKASKSIPSSFKIKNKALMLKSYITVLFLWGDRFFLSIICTPEMVAEYDISLKIAMLMMVFIEALKASYAPVFARHNRDILTLKRHIKKSTRVGFFFSFVILVIIIAFGKLILGIFGPEFIASYSLLIIIALGYFFSAIFGQADNVVEMCGLAKYYIKPYFVITLFSLILGSVLSYKFGPIGMAIGFAVGTVLFQAIASVVAYKRLGLKTRFI